MQALDYRTQLPSRNRRWSLRLQLFCGDNRNNRSLSCSSQKNVG